MAETVVNKNSVCVECGVDVRDGTQFCYACGKPVIEDTTDDTAIELQEMFPITEMSDNPKAEKSEKLASAAAERKKFRIGRRKPKQVVWEEPGDFSNRIFVLVCLLIFVLVAGVVFLTVFIK